MDWLKNQGVLYHQFKKYIVNWHGHIEIEMILKSEREREVGWLIGILIVTCFLTFLKGMFTPKSLQIETYDDACLRNLLV